MNKKIGILGGSFNPIHEAHISVAHYFIEYYSAEKVLFIPCNVSPFKTNEDMAPNKNRLEMVKLAIANNPSFEVSSFELENKEYRLHIRQSNISRDYIRKIIYVY